MATEKLRFDFLADTSGLDKGVEVASRRLSGLTSAARQGDLALIELGRGVSDARFGFAGLGNNLQRMVEIFGYAKRAAGSTGGALKAMAGNIIGTGGLVAAMSILIAYAPEILQFFKSFFDGAEDTAESVDKLRDKILEMQGVAFDPNTDLYGKVREDIEDINDQLAKIDRIEKNRIRQQKELEQKYVDQRETLIGQRAEYEGLIQDASDLFVQTQKEKDAREAAKMAAKQQREFLKDHKKLMEEINMLLTEQEFKVKAIGGVLKDEYGQGLKDVFDFSDINPNEKAVVPIDDILVLDEGDLDIFGKFEDEVAKPLEQKFFDIAGAASSMGDAIGTALRGGEGSFAALAAGMLGVIGDLLIQMGTAAVAAANLSSTFAIPGIGLAAGLAAIGIGTAIKAATSSAASGGFRSGGGGGNSGRGTIAAQFNTGTPTVNFRIGNNELIGTLQRGQDTRGQFLGQSTLTSG